MAKSSGGGGKSGRGGGGGLKAALENTKSEYNKTVQGLRNLDNEVKKLEQEGSTNRGQRNHQLYNSLLTTSMDAQHKVDILKTRYKNIKKRLG